MSCERCVCRKAFPEKAAEMVNIKTTRPLELVCMDFLSLEPDKSNTKDILVITDHFTKYAVAVPTRNQKAQTVARCLWENFLVHYGFPERPAQRSRTGFRVTSDQRAMSHCRDTQGENYSLPPERKSGGEI